MDKKLLINNRLVVSRFYDLLFICMPLWVPISYFCLTSYFPTHNLLIFFLYLFILGETHFGATWLFFLYPNNRAWVCENKYFSIFIPLLIITTLIILAIKSIELMLLIILIYNFFHVTRQSIGIIKIYAFKINNKKLKIIYIYIINILCAAVGIFRFIIPINIVNENLFILSIVIVLLSFSYFIFLLIQPHSKMSVYFITSVLTGILLYSPFLFARTIQDAFAMGVGMHYSQYLALVIPINLRRLKQKDGTNQTKIAPYKRNSFLLRIFLYLLFYSGIMVSLTFSKVYIDYYYLIPLFFQTTHFYLEGFIWRFSNNHIKNNMGKFMFTTDN